ncbi:MAG TPA: leucine-rich repeat domain-containing protein [Pyrinomonadaceae bacterium]|nr:leucine-rich repeat domain-containing protein [Pyrinomonadaceae bacterium]
MAKSKAYRAAEKKIEAARRSGATELNLGNDWGAAGAAKLTELPDSLAQLTQLRKLDVDGNQLTALPESLGQLTRLRTLFVSRNQLTALPESLGQLTQLHTLHVSRNELTTLPESLGQLTQLHTLYFFSNQLTALPESFGQLTQLQELYLFNNQLTALPESLGQLTQLQNLYLSDNQLTALPESLSQLTQLQELYLFNNQLTALPESLGQLTHLQELYLANNRMVQVPAAIGDLQKLEVLDLRNNRLAELPFETKSLSNLKGLFLHNNPSLDLPEDLLGPAPLTTSESAKPPREILDYYFSTRGAEGVALREMKLIVVGWGKAGKTSLVKRLSGGNMDPTEPETHGITIQPLTLHCADGDLKARVWDFGGQHVLHAMHEFFLTARSLYLLVIEQRGDRAEADAKYWLQLIRSYAPKAPVVVALNKSQGVLRQIDKETLERTYGPIIAWVPTECLPEAECPGASQTITDLRDALTAAAEEDTMPEPRRRFPRKWVGIKDWLEGLDKAGINFLDYETFSRECAERGEPDAQKQAEVAALMHDLGVAMNYARDERLRDTTVLRPDWLANGIYAILRANLLVPGKALAPDAVLTAEKLGEIYAVAAQPPVKMLNAEDYPTEKWGFLLQLMNLFQLSFPINESGSSQLCPTLLGAEPPPETDEPQGADTVRLRYEFEVVPAPLLPRFMVRTFSLIARAKLWQRGAILRYPSARARVWTTAEEKYLFVTLAGPEAEREELLAIIRSTLMELFDEYRDLKVTEQYWFEGEWVPRKTLERFGVLEPDLDYDVAMEEVL